MALVANWNYPTSIAFGAGRIDSLADVCETAGLKRPLLVTDSGLATSAMIGAALSRNQARGLPTSLFSGVRPNPTAANILEGIRVMREGGHDGVIAFGGGSALDAGKAIAFLAHQSRPIWDFEDVGCNWQRADLSAIRPSVAVPTTAGTGSEVGRVSVITDEKTKTKRLIFHPRILPVAVIADPQLTLGVPAAMTAATGMDALAHCLEAYCAPGFHPMADGIALEGMRLIRTALPRAVRQGQDLEARAEMMAAATMGAVAFQKGLGAIHSLSHPLGAIYDAHHGLLNGILMPYVLAFNRAAISEKMDRLATYLGLPGKGVDAVLGWILDLRRELGIPNHLRSIGIDAAQTDVIIAAALADPTAPTNPVRLEAGPLRELFLSALGEA